MDAHLILYVENQERATRFYAAVLDRSARLDVPGMTEFELADHAILGLMPVAGIRELLGPGLPTSVAAAWAAWAAGAAGTAGAAGAAGAPPRAEIYLVIDDPESAHARALAAGAQEISPRLARSWGAEVSYVLDPDGYVLAFAGPAL